MEEKIPKTKKAVRWGSPSAIVVWGLSAIMTGALVWLIIKFGSNVPLWDGWDMVPVFTDYQPITLDWLWSQHNEHRVPLPRLTSIVLYKITGVDLKIGMLFNASLMILLSIALVRAASRDRGYVSWTDAFFPLSILHLGHATNYLWAWQTQYFLSSFISGIILLILFQTPSRISFKNAAIGVGTGLLGMIMCGANGLAVVPPLLAWMGYLLFFASNRFRISYGQKMMIAFIGISVLLLAGAYFIGYKAVPFHPDGHGIRTSILTAIQVFTVGFAPGLHLAWPFAGLLALVLLTGCLWLLLEPYRQEEERDQAVGLFAFVAGIGLLCLAIGYGRNNLGLEPEAIETQFVNEIRYLILIVPIWCGIYLIFSRYAPEKYNQWIRGGMCITALLLIWPNTQLGINYSQKLRSNFQALEKDIEAGMAPYELILEHKEYLHINQDISNDYFPMLREAKLGYFQYLAENPKFEKLDIPLEISYAPEVQFSGDTLLAKGPFSYISIKLPAPRLVNGIFLKYIHSNSIGQANFRMLIWNEEDIVAGPKENIWLGQYPHKFYQPTGDFQNWPNGTWLKVKETEPTSTHWLNDTIKEIRIYPDLEPCKFVLKEIELLVLPDEIR